MKYKSELFTNDSWLKHGPDQDSRLLLLHSFYQSQGREDDNVRLTFSILFVFVLVSLTDRHYHYYDTFILISQSNPLVPSGSVLPLLLGRHFSNVNSTLELVYFLGQSYSCEDRVCFRTFSLLEPDRLLVFLSRTPLTSLSSYSFPTCYTIYSLPGSENFYGGYLYTQIKGRRT